MKEPAAWLDDRLRLALLKENAKYRTFWEKYGGEDKLLATEQEVRDFYTKNPYNQCYLMPRREPEKTLWQFYTELSTFDIMFLNAESPNDNFNILNPHNAECPSGKKLAEVLQVLNPYTEELPDQLPICFHDRRPAVEQVLDDISRPLNDGVYEGNAFPLEHRNSRLLSSIPGRLRPSERLFVIDLERKKSDILNELKNFFQVVQKLQKKDNEGLAWRKNYEQWKTDVPRKRKEAWKQLKVWRLRRKRKSFLQINQETKIKVDTAKKEFARAYELIEGRRYDKKRFKKLYGEIQAPELKRRCATCPDNPDRGGTCTPETLCPDVLAFIEQDQVCRSEQLTETGTAEWLQPKNRKRTCSLSD